MKRIMALLLFLASPAFGQNYFTNSSFEVPALGGIVGGNPFTGWQSLTSDGLNQGWSFQGFGTGGGQDSSGGGITTQGNWLSPQNAPSGTQLGFILGSGEMYQTVQIPSNGVYTLSFWAGTGSQYFSIENFRLQVNGATINRWTSSFLGSQMQFIQTNLNLVAGPNSFVWIGDTNGAAVGSQGYGVNFDLVQTGPFNPGYTANDQTFTANSDGSYQGTLNALQHISTVASPNWVLTVGTNGGQYIWSNSLTIGLSFPIIVQGASATNRPTIYFNTTLGTGLNVSAGTNHFVTLANLILNTTNKVPSGSMIQVSGAGVCFRMTGITFLNAASSHFCILTSGAGDTSATLGPFGLVDHCNFFMPVANNYNCLSLFCNGNGIHYGWQQPMTWGTTNAVYVENCAFSQPNSAVYANACVESQGSARWVFRYCTATNISISTHGIASGAKDGTEQVEIYKNQFLYNDQNPPGDIPYVGYFRGGSMVICSNVIVNLTPGDMSVGFRFLVDCATTEWQQEFCTTQQFYPADYPAYQQIGQGSCTNGITCLQTNWPVYCWSNNMASLTISLGLDADGPFIQQGRDIFTNQLASWYNPLVYPHPLDTTNFLPPLPPTYQTLFPLGNLGAAQNLH
jgi:hypothetical protein